MSRARALHIVAIHSDQQQESKDIKNDGPEFDQLSPRDQIDRLIGRINAVCTKFPDKDKDKDKKCIITWSEALIHNRGGDKKLNEKGLAIDQEDEKYFIQKLREITAAHPNIIIIGQTSTRERCAIDQLDEIENHYDTPPLPDIKQSENPQNAQIAKHRDAIKKAKEKEAKEFFRVTNNIYFFEEGKEPQIHTKITPNNETNPSPQGGLLEVYDPDPTKRANVFTSKDGDRFFIQTCREHDREIPIIPKDDEKKQPPPEIQLILSDGIGMNLDATHAADVFHIDRNIAPCHIKRTSFGEAKNDIIFSAIPLRGPIDITPIQSILDPFEIKVISAIEEYIISHPSDEKELRELINQFKQNNRMQIQTVAVCDFLKEKILELDTGIQYEQELKTETPKRQLFRKLIKFIDEELASARKELDFMNKGVRAELGPEGDTVIFSQRKLKLNAVIRPHLRPRPNREKRQVDESKDVKIQEIYKYKFPGQHLWTVQGIAACVPIAVVAAAEVLGMSDSVFYRQFDPQQAEKEEAKTTLFQWVKQGIRFNAEMAPDLKSNLFLGPMKVVMPKNADDLIEVAKRAKESPWFNLKHVQDLKVLQSTYDVTKDNLLIHCENLIANYKRMGFSINDLTFLSAGAMHQTMFFAKEFPDGRIYFYVFDSSPSRAVGGQFQEGSMEVYDNLSSALEAIKIRWKSDISGEISVVTTQDKFIKVQDYMPIGQLKLALAAPDAKRSLEDHYQLLGKIIYHLKENKLEEIDEKLLLENLKTIGDRYIIGMKQAIKKFKDDKNPHALNILKELEKKNSELLNKLEQLYEIRQIQNPDDIALENILNLKMQAETEKNICQSIVEHRIYEEEKTNVQYDRNLMIALCRNIMKNLQKIRRDQLRRTDQTQEVYDTIVTQVTQFYSGLQEQTISTIEVLQGLQELSEAKTLTGMRLYEEELYKPLKLNLNELRNRDNREAAQQLFPDCFPQTEHLQPSNIRTIKRSKEIIPNSLQDILFQNLSQIYLDEKKLTKDIQSDITLQDILIILNKLAETLSLKEQCFFVSEIINLLPNPEIYTPYILKIQEYYDDYLRQQEIVDNYLKAQIKLKNKILSEEKKHDVGLQKIQKYKEELRELNSRYQEACIQLTKVEKISPFLKEIYLKLRQEKTFKKARPDQIRELIHSLCDSSQAEDLLSLGYVLDPVGSPRYITISLLNNLLRKKEREKLFLIEAGKKITTYHIINYITGRIDPHHELPFEKLESIVKHLNKGENGLANALLELHTIPGLEGILDHFKDALIKYNNKFILISSLKEAASLPLEEEFKEFKEFKEVKEVKEIKNEFKMSPQLIAFLEKGELHKHVFSFNHIRQASIQYTQAEDYANSFLDWYEKRKSRNKLYDFQFTNDDILILKNILEEIYSVAKIDRKNMSWWNTAIGLAIKKYYNKTSAIAERLPAFVDAQIMKEKSIISGHLGQRFTIALSNTNVLKIISQNLSISGLRDFTGQPYIESKESLIERLTQIRKNFKMFVFDIRILQEVDFDAIREIGYPDDHKVDHSEDSLLTPMQLSLKIFKAWIRLPDKYKFIVDDAKPGLVTIYNSKNLEIIEEQKHDEVDQKTFTALNSPEGILRTKFKHKATSTIIICNNIHGKFSFDSKQHEEAVRSLHHFDSKEAQPPAIIFSGGYFNAPVYPTDSKFQDCSTSLHSPLITGETLSSRTGLFYSMTDSPDDIIQSQGKLLDHQKPPNTLEPISIEPFDEPEFLKGPYRSVMFSENHMLYGTKIKDLVIEIGKQQPSPRDNPTKIHITVQKNKFNAHQLVIQSNRPNLRIHALRNVEHVEKNGLHYYTLKPLEIAEHNNYLMTLIKKIDPVKKDVLNSLLKQIRVLSTNNDDISNQKIEYLNKIYMKLSFFNKFDDYKSYNDFRNELIKLAMDKENAINKFNRGSGYIGAMLWQRELSPITGTSRVILLAAQFLTDQYNKAHKHEILQRQALEKQYDALLKRRAIR